MTIAMKAEITPGIPIGRLASASDVANVFPFLGSDLSAVTGVVLDGSGGMFIH
jgi:NAD(P)-dependent dehydrogenase (short-subunit alcohol dehydrogenase family)